MLSVCHVSETPDDVKLKELTPRQAAFVKEYLVDLNATQAAVRAGYSSDSAQAQSSVLMTQPHIAAAVERGKAQRAARVNVQQDEIIHELAALANSRVDHYVVDDNGNIQLAEGAPDNAMAAVKSVKRRKTIREDKAGNITIVYDVTIELHDKPGQLKLLGRHIGLFADKIEHTGRNGGPIETVTRIESVIVDPKKEKA